MRPITVQPGFSEADVLAVLFSKQYIKAECFTLIPLEGSPLRYSNLQRDVSVVPVGSPSRETYNSKQIIFNGLRFKTGVGVEVDEQQMELSYPSTQIYQASLTFAQALLHGRLDGAIVRRDRFIRQDWESPWVGGWPMFAGRMSSLDRVGRMAATLNVKSDLVLLNVQMPRDLWLAGCKNTWGDVNCGVVQSDWAVLGVASGTPTRSVIPWTGSSSDYTRGKIHITDFDSVTHVRTILKADSSALTLIYPLPFDVTAGMEFTAFPGCSRTNDATTGCPKYHGTDWPTRYKGFPFIPVAETAA